MKITLTELRALVRESSEESQDVVQVSLSELEDIVIDLKTQKFDLVRDALKALERLEAMVKRGNEDKMGRQYPMGKFGKGRS